MNLEEMKQHFIEKFHYYHGDFCKKHNVEFLSVPNRFEMIVKPTNGVPLTFTFEAMGGVLAHIDARRFYNINPNGTKEEFQVFRESDQGAFKTEVVDFVYNSISWGLV